MKWFQRARVSPSPPGREVDGDELAVLAPVLARRGGLALDLLGRDPEALPSVERDRAGVAADDLAELGVVAHRGRDDHLATLVVVGHHRRHVGHVAAVVLEVEPAAADDPAREPDAHRLDQVGELVHEQVGVHAAAEVPVTPPLGVLGAVERLVGSQAEVGPQEHLPVDRLGVHVLDQRIIPPLAHRRCCGSSWSGPA